MRRILILLVVVTASLSASGLVVVLVVTASLLGNGEKARLANREEIAKLLPGDLKLADRIPRETGPGSKPWGPRAVESRKTVEQTLIEIGARIDDARILVDAQGRKIVFEKEFMPGTPALPRKNKDGRTPETLEREEYLEKRRVQDVSDEPGHRLPLKTRHIIIYEIYRNE